MFISYAVITTIGLFLIKFYVHEMNIIYQINAIKWL